MTHRTPAGRPAGGQYTTAPHREATVALAAPTLTLASTPRDVAAAAHDVDPRIRLTAAYHPLAEPHRAELSRDSDPTVREAAANAAQYGDADLAIAFDLVARLANATG